MFTHGDHVTVYGNYRPYDKTIKQVSRMEVSHTHDGYWALSGYVDQKYEDTQATMAKAKDRFIKANPLIDASKVVVVNGEFNDKDD